MHLGTCPPRGDLSRILSCVHTRFIHFWSWGVLTSLCTGVCKYQGGCAVVNPLTSAFRKGNPVGRLAERDPIDLPSVSRTEVKFIVRTISYKHIVKNSRPAWKILSRTLIHDTAITIITIPHPTINITDIIHTSHSHFPASYHDEHQAAALGPLIACNSSSGCEFLSGSITLSEVFLGLFDPLPPPLTFLAVSFSALALFLA